VHVTFDPQATPQFKFDKDKVEMKAAGKIKLQRAPNSNSKKWKFRGATVKDDRLNEFRTRLGGQGQFLDIMDDFLDEHITTYSYNITVELDGQTYTSPDPVIVNDPGGFIPPDQAPAGGS
jgi:hypothetical protein